MNSATPIAIAGDALACAVLALRLHASDPAVQLYVSLDALQDAEGEVFPLGPDWLANVVSCDWPGFLIEDDGAMDRVVRPIGLIDPLQCYAQLIDCGAAPIAAAPQTCRRLSLKGFDPLVAPSRILMADEARRLDWPVLFETSKVEGTYRQYLPLATDAVMLRTRRGGRQTANTLFDRQAHLLGHTAR